MLDAYGRQTRLDRWRTVQGDWGARTVFGYDSASRLANLFTNINGTTWDATATLAYNPAGQIAGNTRDNDAYAWPGHVNLGRGYTSNGLNQHSAVAGVSHGYDANGNLSSYGSRAFVYDVENRMVTANIGSNTATLRYDPLGRLYEVSDTAMGLTRFLYDGSDLVAEYNSSGTLLRRYAHGLGAGDDPLVWFEGSGVADSARRYLYADERGSIIAITNSNGAKLTVNTYDEYGIPGANNDGRFQYTGQAWIPELGMYYYKARMYSPTLGRFMQTDPVDYGDGMNMYRYVGNDPVNAVDPTGMMKMLDVPKPIKPFNGLGFSSMYAEGWEPGNSSNKVTGPMSFASILDFVGKVWALPNTILGAVFAGVSYIAGEILGTNPSFSIGNNAIQLFNSPLLFNNAAVAIGNVVIYPGTPDATTQSTRYDQTGTVPPIPHETAHTYQSQILGLFYLLYIGIGRLLGTQDLEHAADDYAAGVGGVLP